MKVIGAYSYGKLGRSGRRVAVSGVSSLARSQAGCWGRSCSESRFLSPFIFPEPVMAEFFRSVGHREGETPPELTSEDWRRIMEKHQMRSRRD